MSDFSKILSVSFHSIHHLRSYLEYSLIAFLSCDLYSGKFTILMHRSVSFDKHIQSSNHHHS